MGLWWIMFRGFGAGFTNNQNKQMRHRLTGHSGKALCITGVAKTSYF